jgi:hypothetical protein
VNRFFIYIIGGFFIVLLFVQCNKIKKVRIDNKVKEAEKLQILGKYKDALIRINEALDIDSSVILPYIVKGKINTLIGNYSSSIQDFNKVLSLDPGNVLAYFQKGVTYSFKQSYDSSIYFYNEAIAQKGSDTLYFQLNHDNPLENEDAKCDIDMPVIRYYRGCAFYEKKSYGNALNDFDFCISSGYNKKNSFFYIGIIYISMNLYDKGCLNLKLAIENGNLDAGEYLNRYCK